MTIGRSVGGPAAPANTLPPDQGRAVLNFFDWSWKHGGKAAEKLDYVPLPAAVTTRIRAIWKSDLKAADGKPLVK